VLGASPPDSRPPAAKPSASGGWGLLRVGASEKRYTASGKSNICEKNLKTLSLVAQIRQQFSIFQV